MTHPDEKLTASRRSFLKSTGAVGASIAMAGGAGGAASIMAATPAAAASDKPKDGPLHTYLTYSDDPTTTIDVNLCVKRRTGRVTVYYDTVPRDGNPKSYANKIEATYYQTLIELYDRRAIYMATLKDQKPGQTYYFVGGDPEYGYTTERSFCTLPGGDKPFRFVDGGDMNIGERARKLLKWAGEQDPDFVTIGGDIPYANGLFSEYVDWIQWFKNWDDFMHTSDGRMIPMVAAIGNHETNSYISDDINMRSPFYLGFFGRQGKYVFHTKKFSDDVVIFFLDTGHLISIDGWQTDWLGKELEKHKDVKYKFANYHVPLYPAHRDFEGLPSKMARTHWGPLFDKYGLTIGYEHHDHVFKRSRPLKDNKVVERGEGTIYLGDGTFGVDPREVDSEPRWYNEKEGQIAHFWVTDVRPDGLSFKAINEDGEEVDAFTLP
ncbi:MAG: metallophosphoesterase family protein [Candidatus Hydrogenedentes bacterium]|nr:metallophosphoesterase family protein [Candidatus Hydrogenedentota bacterium]